MGKSSKILAAFDAADQENYTTGRMEMFLQAFHANPEGLALSDEQGRVVYRNALFDSVIRQGILTQDLSAYIGSVEYSRTVSAAQIEIVLSPFQKLSRISLDADAGGAAYLWVVHVHSAAVDSQQVRTLRKLYQAFVDNTFELVFRTSGTDTVLFANPRFFQTFGFASHAEAKGTTLDSLFESAADYQKFKKQVFEEGRVANATLHFRTAEGKQIVGLVNCQVYADEHEQRVLHWTVLDISDRVQYEASLKSKNDQLAKVNSQMEKFLYSTSHDLRSPLTSILGLINLLRFEIKDKNHLEYISKIEESTQRLDKIIRDVVSFSKTTYLRVQSEKIDFESQTWKVINAYRAHVNDKRIHFDVEVNEQQPFYSDHERLEIILSCLIQNAIAFTDVNKLRPFVRINICTNADEAVIEIIDNGIGIGRQHLDQVFNMFYKASLQSTGAGLGLYIVKEGVEQLKGTIQLESEIGFGSVFKLRFPNDRKDKLVQHISTT